MKDETENNSTITLTVGDTDIVFEPTLTAYNQCLNDAAKKNNITGAMRDYLLKIVTPASRDALKQLLQRPGIIATLTQAVNEEFAPEVDIRVKK
ncbi:TPA: hypothetical protein QIF36_004166 [Enterobacter kobei]|nr:hypothetical protein [Enterobacter kobei]